MLEIIAARIDQSERAARVSGPPFGNGNRHLARQIFAGQRGWGRDEILHRALRDNMSAVNASAGPDIEHVIGGADGVLVVFYHDHSIAEITETLEGVEQPRIVALVQPDRRLVEHIEHAREAGADLRGETNALAFTPGERSGGACQCEIFEPNIHEESKPFADFLEHPHRNLVLLGIQRLWQLREPFAGPLDRHIRDLADVQSADLHAQCLGFESIAVARSARNVGEIFGHLLARPLALGLAPASLEVGHNALERLSGLVGAQPVVVDEPDRILARAVEDRLLRFLRQVLPFAVEAKFVVLAEGEQRLRVVGRA